jgi:hypothetical protein
MDQIMSRTCRVVAAFIAAGMFLVSCGDKPTRSHYEKAGAFSYEPPTGWRIVEVPGLKYRVASGPAENEFAPTVNFVDEMFAGTVAEYADTNIKHLHRVFGKVKILSLEDFKTEDNETGVKVVTENEQHGRMLRQTFYFLGSGSRRYVITCTALADDGAKHDKAFAESVESFRMHKSLTPH